jgi:simple sugar transport system permease protein
MRGVGEQPEAAATLGVSVNQLRYLAVLACGLLCGLAGAQLSLGNVTLFVENMSAGRGWIAVVSVMLGQSTPLGVFLASTLFGFADSLGFRLQGLGLASQFTGMVPYLVTLLALFFLRARQKRQRSALAV